MKSLRTPEWFPDVRHKTRVWELLQWRWLGGPHHPPRRGAATRLALQNIALSAASRRRDARDDVWPCGRGRWVQKREGSSGGYHATGPGHEGRASGKRKTSRAGFTAKVTCSFAFPIGEFRFVGAHRVGQNEWKLDAADDLN